jgi:hypothetical protein
MKEIVEQVIADPRYQKNIEYGEPRLGHPEGKVKFHIADLEANLDALTPHGISQSDYWKLKFLIHVHDTFKAEAEQEVRIAHPRSHASLARAFAAEFTDDSDLLNMIQLHDEGYALWQQFNHRGGAYHTGRFQSLLETIHNWDLFLIFTIIDGCTPGKDRSKLVWFIREVKKYKETMVDASWVNWVP